METGTDESSRFPVGAKVTLGELETEPYGALRRLQQAEPVSFVPALGAWLITGRDPAIEAMRDAERFTVDDPRFSTGAVLGRSMLTVEGMEHDRHRGPFAPSFRPGVVREKFDHFLTTEATRLASAMADRGRAELRTELAGPLAVNTITRFLGLRDVTADDVLRWYRDISEAITNFNVKSDEAADGGRHPSVARLYEQVTATLEIQADPDVGPDSSLVRRIAAEGVLAPDEIAASVAVLMFGAVETSEGMTTNALWHLLTNPEALDRVRTDRSLIGPAVEESLRLEPAAAVIDRYTTVDTTIGGVTIPAGELVTISLLAANRDPAMFANPDRFDIDRGNARQHLTFVQGPHGCIGLHLARMETVAAIEAVLAVGPQLTVDAERTTRPQGLIFRKPDRLVVDFNQPSDTTT